MKTCYICTGVVSTTEGRINRKHWTVIGGGNKQASKQK